MRKVEEERWREEKRGEGENENECESLRKGGREGREWGAKGGKRGKFLKDMQEEAETLNCARACMCVTAQVR